jgi:hypothetical protein
MEVVMFSELEGIREGLIVAIPGISFQDLERPQNNSG